MRLLLTGLGTLWVSSLAVAYIAFGLSLSIEGQIAWWFFGWILAGGVGSTPFILYCCLDGNER